MTSAETSHSKLTFNIIRGNNKYNKILNSLTPKKSSIILNNTVRF